MSNRRSTERTRPRWMRPVMLVLVGAFAFAVSGPFVTGAGAQDQDGATDDDGIDEVVENGGPRVVATLTAGDDAEPVEGVVITAALDGAEVAEGVTDEEGFVAIELPGAGQYDVTLDESSLPEGVALDNPDRATLSPRVQESGDRSVVFRLTTEGQTVGVSATTLERLASLVASGTRFGLIIALAAVGLSLIFGTTGLTNFAHGELIAFGAIATWYLNSNIGGLGLHLFVATIGGIVAAALFGGFFELGVYRPLRRRGMPIVSQMVVSIGLALAFRYLFSIVFGSNAQQFSQFAAQAPAVDLGIVQLRPKDLVMAGTALVVLVAFGLFLQRSRLGTAIRAVSDNKELSIASGIDDKKVTLMVWMTAGALAGLSGVMLGSSEFIGWNMGQRVLLITFAAVLLGGLGTTFGAMFGGLFVGIISDVSTFWLDADLKIIVALATLVAVLLIRPQGVFGVRARTA